LPRPGFRVQREAMPGIDISILAAPADLGSWLGLARRLEAGGFRALLAADHPGSGAAPWPALGAAAAVTRTLGLGTYVAQGGVREPVHVAADAATLDILAPGRVLLGIGAGHTPQEWADIGRDRPSPAERAGRLAEFAEAAAALLQGRQVTAHGQHLTLRESRLDSLPAGGRVRLAIGGGHPLILRTAARLADVVGLSGLGRTLPDGHLHAVRWSQAELHRQLRLVRDEARQAGRSPVIEALVQDVRLTRDRAAAIEEISAKITGATEQDVAGTPFLLIGSHEEMAAQLERQARELGITRYAGREQAVPVLENVLALINRK
jgi:probable F420-dependent oxidoreductase